MSKSTPRGYTSFILIFIGLLFTLTIFHDPLLHGLIALIYGWKITGFEVGILTGYTSIQTLTASTFQMWTFYMFPAIFLCLASFLLLYIHPDRIIFIVVLILFILNINSLNPYASGSDAFNASEVLNKALLPGELIHLTIFLLFVGLFATTCYIVIENNSKDAQARINTTKSLIRGRI